MNKLGFSVLLKDISTQYWSSDWTLTLQLVDDLVTSKATAAP